MKTGLIRIAFAGIFLGAASWGVVGLVSNRFEPFDSGTGLLIGQLVLSLSSFAIAYRTGMWKALLFVAASYVGMNVYANVFGTTEQRAWFILGLVTTLSLIISPVMCALLGRLAHSAMVRFRNNSQ